MLWKLALTIASICTSLFSRAPVVPDHPYEATPYGPQSWEEEFSARHALQGEYDDIRYYEDDDPSDAGRNGTYYRWPGYPGGGTVAYVLDAAVQKDQKLVKLINDAIKQYETKTCIRFVKRTNQPNYVQIIKDDRKCYSYVGLIRGMRPQTLSLGGGCEYIGTVVHELGHAIGLYHEHQRSDRDKHVTVYLNNVKPGESGNFNKTNPIDELKWAKYDYSSIMHYGNYAFSKQPGKLKTMEATDGRKLLEPYDRPGLNNNDIALVKKLYKC